MTQFLPPNLLALFAARDPIPYLPPAAKLPHEKKQKGYDGVGAFLHNFELPSETPAPCRAESRPERLERRQRERAEQAAYLLEQDIALWSPHHNPAATADPFKTLFVARCNYDTSESKLRREFEGYGPIKKICMIFTKSDNKPRGYAFIEYEHERDMHSAYKHADGKKIDGRRVLVDVERARTVKGWLPRRLGGGLGGTRRGGADVNVKHSGREDNERERERERERGRERGNRENNREAARAPRRRSGSRRRSRSRRRGEGREGRAGEAREGREGREGRGGEARGDARGEGARGEDEPRRRRRSRSGSRRRDKERHGGERREKERDKDRDKERRRRDKERVKTEDVKIKIEPPDDYPEFGTMAAELPQIKQEPDDKYRPEYGY